MSVILLINILGDKMMNIKNSAQNIVRKTELTRFLASCIYRRYLDFKYKQEFHSRISNMNLESYLDSTSKPDLNVIILTVDCLRYSNLSFQGYHRETSPFLDSFKHKFKGVSASPWTYPSVASILTGLYPHNHNAVISDEIKNFDTLRGFQKIKKNVISLPELLYFLGYDIYFGTAIATAFYPLRGRTVPKMYGYDSQAENMLYNLQRWISKRNKPFFAYLQLGDLHEPINLPDSFKSYFGKVKNLPKIDRWDFRRPEEQEGEKFREYKQNRVLLYDNTLRYVDHAIEQFYTFLEDSGLMDSTIFIVTADHGEEFWEHSQLEAANFYDPRGYYGVGHGHNVFEEIINVPVLMSGPIPYKPVPKKISTVDIMPTIIDLLGIDFNSKLDGKNIFEIDDKPLLSEAVGYGYEKKSLDFGRYKLIYSKDDNVKWVFDLKNDPAEQQPIKDEEISSVFVEKLFKMLKKDEVSKLKSGLKNK